MFVASPRTSASLSRAQVESLEGRTLFTALPDGFDENQFGGPVDKPTSMDFAPDGRLFVCEQGRNGVAQVRVIKNGTMLDAPFLTVNVDQAGERGLGCLTFDPDFAKNGYVYVHYTTPEGGSHNRVSRFTANGDVAAPGSEKILMDLDVLGTAPIHNGGSLHFGSDGKLYITTGDNFQPLRAQLLDNTFGKVMRINSDGSIPADNPFYDQTYGNNRAIWALGFRNPFTSAIQPGTGLYYINDVGQDTWEEINQGERGGNYGWPNIEGPISNQTPPPNYHDPIYAYPHNGTGRSITGGDFYNPDPAHASFPAEYLGKYFWGEHVLRQINVFDPATKTVTPFGSDLGNVTDIDVGPDGALYYTRYGTGATQGSGRVFKIFNTVKSAPVIAIAPKDVSVEEGHTAVLSAGAVGSGTLEYQWQRDGEDIPGATAPTYEVNYPETGSGSEYRVVVKNSLGTATSEPVKVIVTPSEGPRITQVSVGDINWTADFKKVLGGSFFAIPAGASQLTPLPFASFNTIQLTFDVAMSSVPQRITLSGVSGQVRSFSLSSTSQDQRVANYYADGIIPNPVREADRFTFTVESSSAVSAVGQQLNGEWTNGQSQFPSGDQNPGGDFNFAFNFVPGDVDRSGVVTAFDLVLMRNRIGRTTTAHGTSTIDYSYALDLDGNGVVGATDLVTVRNRIGTRLPDATPTLVFGQRRIDWATHRRDNVEEIV